MKILLLSAYDTASHRYWHEALRDYLPDHDWTVLCLPGRNFAWRIRGNSLSWAYEQRDLLEADYDLLIATSMTDLSALRGFVPKLARLPTLVYFHENQFAYPLSEHQKHQQVFNQTLNLYTALCADRIAFNSAYNRDTFLEGVRTFLNKMPDHVPGGILEQLRERSSVLPVPLKRDCFENRLPQPGVVWADRHSPPLQERPLRIAWAARWEYDKGPERLLSTITTLESSGLDYRLCILGERFRKCPEEFSIIRQRYGHRIEHMGYAENRACYLAWLRGADIILSTAIHEFQGIAVQEAVALGCVPVVPDGLAYPEFISDEMRYEQTAKHPSQQAACIVGVIQKQHQALLNGEMIVSPSWACRHSEVSSTWHQALDGLCPTTT